MVMGASRNVQELQNMTSKQRLLFVGEKACTCLKHSLAAFVIIFQEAKRQHWMQPIIGDLLQNIHLLVLAGNFEWEF